MPKPADLARKVILNQKLKRYIDINTDFGQNQDRAFFDAPEESNLLNIVTSVNIPCCVHDGDPVQIIKDIAKAKTYNCAIGAHIAYPDPVNYGYKEMKISDEELAAWIRVQLGSFKALCQANGLDIEHVRPHGALYGKLMTDKRVARAVAETLYSIDPWLILIGPAGAILNELKDTVGNRIAPEIYLGKRYAPDGNIVGNRFHENLSPQGIYDQVKQVLNQNSVVAVDGKQVQLDCSTFHVSPRLPNAVEVTDRVSQMMGQAVPLSVGAVGTSGWL